VLVKSLRSEIFVKFLKQLLDNPYFAKPLLENGHLSRVRNTVHHAKANKFLEGAPIMYLEFEFLVAKIIKLLENKDLEQDQRVDQFAACIARALSHIAIFEK
jgi:hypothetical protein